MIVIFQNIITPLFDRQVLALYFSNETDEFMWVSPSTSSNKPNSDYTRLTLCSEKWPMRVPAGIGLYQTSMAISNACNLNKQNFMYNHQIIISCTGSAHLFFFFSLSGEIGCNYVMHSPAIAHNHPLCYLPRASYDDGDENGMCTLSAGQFKLPATVHFVIHRLCFGWRVLLNILKKFPNILVMGENTCGNNMDIKFWVNGVRFWQNVFGNVWLAWSCLNVTTITRDFLQLEVIWHLSLKTDCYKAKIIVKL